MYSELNIDFTIPEDVQTGINKLLNYLNSGKDPLLSDCERTELNCELNWCLREKIMTEEQLTLPMPKGRGFLLPVTT
jgi:hypothetical protein